MGRLAWTLALALLMACRDEAPPPPPPVPSASAAPSAAASTTITVSLDGRAHQVAVGSVQRRLADVLPEPARDPRKWRELSASSGDGRDLVLRRYGEQYADYDALLYRDAAGKPTLGIFRRILPDTPAHLRAQAAKPHLALSNAARVEVRVEEVAPAPAPSPSKLLVALDGVEQSFDLGRLDALPRESPPDPKPRSGDDRGIALREVVALIVDPARVAQVKLVGADDDLLLIRGEAVRNPEVRALLRVNRRGQLGLTVWDTPDAEPRRLRDVVKLIIATAP